jgi:molybdenum-dependent DNA-binding transcriptional regulator ModE
MVKERRSVQELEQLLEEMLVSMRKRRSEGQISV